MKEQNPELLAAEEKLKSFCRAELPNFGVVIMIIGNGDALYFENLGPNLAVKVMQSVLSAMLDVPEGSSFN
jgi:hypothetical protein